MSKQRIILPDFADETDQFENGPPPFIRAACILVLLLVIATAIVLSSCAVVKGNSNTGDWMGGFVATDADSLGMTSAGFNASKFNQSKGLKIVADTVRKIWQAHLIAEGLKFVAGEYYGLEGAKVSSAQAIELEKLRNAASVAEAESQLAILNATPAA